MKLIKNPEVKMSVLVHFIITAIACGIGFWINPVCGILTLCLSFVFGAHFLISTQLRYNRISNLSRDIDRILHGSEALNLEEYVEGELAILRSEIYKMTVRMREQADTLQKDRKDLADALADISHQIRTPLTSLNLLVSLLQSEKLDDKRRVSLSQQMMRLLSHMEWLIATLLRISRLDAGTVTFQKEAVSVTALLKKAVEPFAVTMELRDQLVEMDVQQDASFLGDPAWSCEAVANVLKNCIEHTPIGGKIQFFGSENALLTEIIIKDTGPGIDKNDLPHLFERFYRGKHAKDQNIGIGLALSRMIATAQNGTIKAENGKDGGAVFTLRFYKSVV